jgi:hypothetical protein
MAINVSILRQVPIMGVCIITLTAILYPIIPGEISSLAKEDGPIENATALILLSLSILLTVKAIRLKKSLTKQSLGYTLVAALLFFLGFGEEISWGQRIFSYETSDFFIQHNRQKEPNFHNLEIGTISINRILFSYGLTIGSIIYFFCSFVLYKTQSWFKLHIDNFGIQLPRIHHTILICVSSALILSIPDGIKWEIWECMFSICILMVFAHPYNAETSIP